MKMELQQPIDSIAIYYSYWMCWKLVGINTGYNKYLCGIYDLVLNIFVTIFYPLHLTIVLFNATQGDIFKNLAINITCFVCSVKHYLFRLKLGKIKAVQDLSAELDKRVLALDEREYFNRELKVNAQRVVNLFGGLYILVNVTSILAVLLGSERRLMYPAWFPFDWQATTLSYWLALIYQIVGVSIQLVQNFANDVYAPMSFCIMAGHVRLLSMRLAKLGNDENKTKHQNNRELIACIEDHKKLLLIFELLQDTLSYAVLAQFVSSGLNMCIVLVFMLFFVDNFFMYMYYSVYFLSMAVELFPCCYYGSILQQEFEQLPYSIFTSNWLMQSKAFHQNLRIFTELANREITALAGGIIGINLNAFFGTCKMAYSLYAVVMRMK